MIPPDAAGIGGSDMVIEAQVRVGLATRGKLRGKRAAIVGLAIVGATVLVAGISAVWTPHSTTAVFPNTSFAAPSLVHPLGTDQYGRDELSRLMVGAQITLVQAALAVLIAAVIGLPVGLLAAQYGKGAEEVLMRGVDILYAFPAVLLATMLAATFGSSTVTATVAVGVAYSPVFARVTRSAARQVLKQNYVLAAKAYGRGGAAILRRHVIPNVAWLIVVQGAVLMSLAILAGSALSYLGLGTAPPTPSWGRMLEVAQAYLYNDPWLAIWPSVAIAGLVLGFNLLGELLQEALSPA